MAYRIRKVSPSSLAATEKCPRFRPDGKENQAADEGIMIHAALEEMVEQHVEQWDNWIKTLEISMDHRALLEEAAAQLRSLLMGHKLDVYPDFRLKLRNGKSRVRPLRPGLYPECEVERGQGQHGYIDLMIIFPDGMVTIVDYKAIRQLKDYSLQLAAYAIDVNRICPAHTKFQCRIIAPRLPTEDIEDHLWDEKDLDVYRKRIESIEESADRSANDPNVPGCPNDACQYCHWNGRCPYQTKAVVQTADAMDVVSVIKNNGFFDGEVITRETFAAPSTVGQRGLRRAFVKLLESAVDAWKEDDKVWAQEHKGTDVPGWKIGWRAGRATLDKSQMTDIRAALMSKLGMTESDILNVSSVDPTLLKEHMVSALGYSEKEAANTISEVLDSFMKTGASYTVWTQMKSKPTASSDVVDV